MLFFSVSANSPIASTDITFLVSLVPAIPFLFHFIYYYQVAFKRNMNFQIHFVAIIVNHLYNFLSVPLFFCIIYTIFKFYLCSLNFLICDRIPFIIKISYDCICISSFLPSKYIIFFSSI